MLWLELLDVKQLSLKLLLLRLFKLILSLVKLVLALPSRLFLRSVVNLALKSLDNERFTRCPCGFNSLLLFNKSFKISRNFTESLFNSAMHVSLLLVVDKMPG